jgi:uncharacterized caspase-like protein
MLARALVAAALLLLAPAARAAAVPDFGTYYALVIGINAYADPGLTRLETAVNDASAVHDLLRLEYGYRSTLLLNPTRYELVRKLEELRNELGESDNLLIYYAGHGVLDRATDEGFWLPVDAEADNRANWLAVRRVTSALKGMFAKHVLVVADSCYSGALSRAVPNLAPSGGARQAELHRLAQMRARTVLTSGGLEPVYDGGGDGHSVFARAFLDILRGNREILDGHSFYARLRQRVVLGAEQTPTYSPIRLAGDEGGDFLFVPKGAVVPAALTAPSPDRRAMELAFWEAIKESGNPAELEAYLDRWPEGTFAALARIRIEELAESGARTPRPRPAVGRVARDANARGECRAGTIRMVDLDRRAKKKSGFPAWLFSDETCRDPAFEVRDVSQSGPELLWSVAFTGATLSCACELK